MCCVVFFLNRFVKKFRKMDKKNVQNHEVWRRIGKKICVFAFIYNDVGKNEKK